MHIRRWLRVLINRSLVLGTIDRPLVHDLVLDFAVAQTKASVLRKNHRAVVEAFRAARPSNSHGRRQFDGTLREDPMASYVCSEGSYHLAKGWEADMENDDHALTHWLGDVPQDELVFHAGQVLGVDRLSSLAARAESRGEWWLAGRYFAIACMLKGRAETAGVASALCRSALDTLLQYLDRAEQAGPDVLDDVHEVQLAMYHKLALTGDLLGLSARSSEVEVVLSSQAGVRDPLAANFLRTMMGFPLMMAGDIERFGAHYLVTQVAMRAAA